MHWSSEDELLDEYNTYEDQYGNVKDVVKHNAEKYHYTAMNLIQQ